MDQARPNAEDGIPHPPTGWELAIAMNAALKGLLGSMGQSGHVCRRTIPVEHWFDTSGGWPELMRSIAQVAAPDLLAGDVVVVADKVVAIAQGRIGPAEILHEPDPKTVDEARREELARHWQQRCGFPVTPLHLLIADEYTDPDGTPRAALGALDHNAAAAALAVQIREETGLSVDVVVSDTDTGLDVLRPLINTVTLGATPLGATAGLTLYECMRCACAAEFERGHDRGVAVVICRPAERCAHRPAMGEPRGYHGALDADREDGLTYVAR